jgi:hypothetical protein
LRCAVDASAIFWAAGMRRKDLFPLLPTGALLAVTLVAGHFLRSNHDLLALLVATFAGSTAVVLGYLFSEDWRTFTKELMSRARVFVSSLINRAEPPPSTTDEQK